MIFRKKITAEEINKLKTEVDELARFYNKKYWENTSSHAKFLDNQVLIKKSRKQLRKKERQLQKLEVRYMNQNSGLFERFANYLF